MKVEVGAFNRGERVYGETRSGAIPGFVLEMIRVAPDGKEHSPAGYVFADA